MDGRRKIEQEGRKEELLAELIKSAAHDIGHLPLSHVMEIQVLGRHGKHEEIGKRILLEDEELQQKYHKISATFLETMKKVCNPNYNDLNLKEQDESNYDIDRLDYLQRDGLYVDQKLELENKPYQLIKVKVDENRQVLLDTDGSVIQAKEGEKRCHNLFIYIYTVNIAY